jgi:hypothetical protein
MIMLDLKASQRLAQPFTCDAKGDSYLSYSSFVRQKDLLGRRTSPAAFVFMDGLSAGDCPRLAVPSRALEKELRFAGLSPMVRNSFQT